MLFNGFDVEPLFKLFIIGKELFSQLEVIPFSDCSLNVAIFAMSSLMSPLQFESACPGAGLGHPVKHSKGELRVSCSEKSSQRCQAKS